VIWLDVRTSPNQLSFLSFVLTGSISAFLNLGVRHLLSYVIFFEAAVACAYVVSTAVAFTLARKFVFGTGAEWEIDLARFVAVNVYGFLQVLAVSTLLLRLLFPLIEFHWHPEDVAHFLGLATLAVTSFYLHRHFSFRRRAPPRSPDYVEQDAEVSTAKGV
jgi:putative flippase GtrA